MDELDRLVLLALQQDGRVPFTQVARQAGVSETTIRARYQKLVQQGVVRVVGVVDPYVLDFEATALVAISVEPGMAEGIAKTIAALPEVSHLVRTLGAYDLVLEVWCRDMTTLSEVVTDQIHQLPGVRATETFLIAENYKMPSDWSPYDEELA
jgi:Lrp/AsnC family transcriptional regulator for asnA, asnC and gidA